MHQILKRRNNILFFLKNFQKLKLLFIFSLLSFPLTALSEYTLKEGGEIPNESFPIESVQELYSNLTRYLETKDWPKLEREALRLVKNYPTTPFAKEAPYLLGISYFEQEEYDLANLYFSEYLTKQATPKYFEQSIYYKFQIAEKFRGGARRHLLGFRSLPKLTKAGMEAVSIYDEVIAAIPQHELATQSLYGKAQVLLKNEEFRSSIEAYQTLIRRFPKHPLAVESYIGIGEVYLKQSQKEYPDPDFLDLAELNLRKFRSAFPGEEKVAIAQRFFQDMQDYYASSLYVTARFYEKTNKWGAAKMYYLKILKSYPSCDIASKSKQRLKVVEEKLAGLKTKS